MIAQLTRNERQLAILISLTVTICGLALAIAGRNDPLGMHGALVMIAGLLAIFWVGSGYYDSRTSNASDHAPVWIKLSGSR